MPSQEEQLQIAKEQTKQNSLDKKKKVSSTPPVLPSEKSDEVEEFESFIADINSTAMDDGAADIARETTHQKIDNNELGNRNNKIAESKLGNNQNNDYSIEQELNTKKNQDKNQKDKNDWQPGGGKIENNESKKNEPKKSSDQATTDKNQSAENALSSQKNKLLNLKSLQEKIRNRDLGGAAEEIPEVLAKKTSGQYLTFLWRTVWLDYTFFTLLSLNVYFFVTLFVKSIAQFGEDKFAGLIFPSGLAKWIEIILLAIIDFFIISVILILIYIIYKISHQVISHPINTGWNYLWGEYDDIFINALQ